MRDGLFFLSQDVQDARQIMTLPYWRLAIAWAVERFWRSFLFLSNFEEEMILLWSCSFVTSMWTGGVWSLEGIQQVYELSVAIFVDWFLWRLVFFLRLDIVWSDQFSPVSAHNCVAITFSLWLFLWIIIISVCNFRAGLLRFLVRTAIIVVNPCSIFFLSVLLLFLLLRSFSLCAVD